MTSPLHWLVIGLSLALLPGCGDEDECKGAPTESCYSLTELSSPSACNAPLPDAGLCPAVSDQSLCGLYPVVDGPRQSGSTCCYDVGQLCE